MVPLIVYGVNMLRNSSTYPGSNLTTARQFQSLRVLPSAFHHQNMALSSCSCLEDSEAAVCARLWSETPQFIMRTRTPSTLVMARWELQDMQAILFLIAHWPDLTDQGRWYTAHRLHLLYIAITKGWQAALYYSQQGTNKFLNILSDFWRGFEPWPRVAL